MKFDDEKLADENSIANMKIKYAGLGTNVRVLQTESKDILSLGKLIKDQDKLFDFLSQKTSGQTSQFVKELQKVNLLELGELKENFSSLNNIDKTNPRFIFRPNNLYLLNKMLAENEIKILLQLFELFSVETKEETKQVLKRIINRRMEGLGIMFLNPNKNFQNRL